MTLQECAYGSGGVARILDNRHVSGRRDQGRFSA
jgi:hypothetical protein